MNRIITDMQYGLCNDLIEAVSKEKKHLEHLSVSLRSFYPLNSVMEFQQKIANFRKESRMAVDVRPAEEANRDTILSIT